MLHVHILLEDIRSAAFALKTIVEMKPVIQANAMNLIANTDFLDTAAILEIPVMRARPSTSENGSTIPRWTYWRYGIRPSYGLPTGSDAKPAHLPSGKSILFPA